MATALALLALLAVAPAPPAEAAGSDVVMTEASDDVASVPLGVDAEVEEEADRPAQRPEAGAAGPHGDRAVPSPAGVLPVPDVRPPRR